MRQHISAALALLVAFTLSLTAATSLRAVEDTWDYSVQVSSAVQASPATITLTWPQDTQGTPSSYTVYRKAPRDTSWGSPIANLPGSATSYTDTSVSSGTVYEYQIVKAAGSYTGYGYIETGINTPLVDSRGKVVLIVDNTMASPLASELARLQQDLAGDGWTVLRHDVGRNDPVTSVKALIAADYNADSANVKSVFLFGHVPVPYSGQLNPDGHPDHIGAWPADVYYGNVNGSWTDNSVNYVQTVNTDPADAARLTNVPGDGKFDQTDIPSNVDLQVGRVDLANMPGRVTWGGPATFPSETELLRAYLNRDHAFRTRGINPPRRAILGDYFGARGGEAFAASGFRSFAPLVGANNVRNLNIEFNDQKGVWIPQSAQNDNLLAYACGAGSYTSIAGIGNTGLYNDGTTTELVSNNVRGVFNLLFGSWLGDWDHEDNMLRAPLATNYGLVSVWSGRPHWFVHPMGQGETIGYVTQLVQNNNGLYQTQINSSQHRIHIALMGDPTLRLHPVAPVGSLNGAVSGSSVALNWSASSDSAIVGYHVYRANSATGAYTRLTSSPITATNYTDSNGSSTASYMVRAVKLESTTSGSYNNASQGVFWSASGTTSSGGTTTTTSSGSTTTTTSSGSTTPSTSGVTTTTTTSSSGSTTTASSGSTTPTTSGSTTTTTSATPSTSTTNSTLTNTSGTVVWFDDALPAGAGTSASGGDSWNWVTSSPTPFSGAKAHQGNVAAGLHEHSFNWAAPLTVNTGEILFTYVYLDPANPPTEIMLSWGSATWEHRAYWGANSINYGTNNTPGRYNMGALPATGQWVRLEVPASAVALEGQTVQGMSFSVYDGRATWDATGKALPTAPSLPTQSSVTVTANDNYAQLGSTTDTAQLTFTRTGDTTSPLVVNFTLGGSAVKWLDYRRVEGDMPTSVTIPAGANTALMTILGISNITNANPETATFTLASDPNYGIGSSATATLTFGTSPSTAASKPVTSSSGSTTTSSSGSTTTTSSGSTTTTSSGSTTTTTSGSTTTTTTASTPTTTTPSSSGDTAWVDDALPAGAGGGGNGETWNWVTSSPAPFSGTKAHQSANAAGLHEHYFNWASAQLTPATGDKLYAYVYIDPSAPTSEIMLSWAADNWEHRAYWGADKITYGMTGTAGHYNAGALPAAGGWVRLEVAASAVGLEGKSIQGMCFSTFDGRVTYDVTGKSSATTASTTTTSSGSTTNSAGSTTPTTALVESVWIEDALPAGAGTGTSGGDQWNWITSNPTPFSGAKAHQSTASAGLHEHFFNWANQTMAVATGDVLFTYVYIDPSNPATEIMLNWCSNNWEHRAYWGANKIGYGTDGTASRHYVGALPATGGWVRLEVPASAVGLEGQSVQGMCFSTYDGRVTYDKTGKANGSATTVASSGSTSTSGGSTTTTSSGSTTSTTTVATTPVVTVAATSATAVIGSTTQTGQIQFARTGDTSSAMVVNFTLGGTAVKWTDYRRDVGDMPVSVTIPAGSASTTMTILGIANVTNATPETATFTLSPDAAYTVGSGSSALLTIASSASTSSGSTTVASGGSTTSTTSGTTTTTTSSGSTTVASGGTTTTTTSGSTSTTSSGSTTVASGGTTTTTTSGSTTTTTGGTVTLPTSLAENAMSEEPLVGDNALTILSPTVLELRRITTKQPDPATVTDWNFVDSSGNFSAPATSKFAVTVGGKSVSVTTVGFRRRVAYAPLAVRDLRIDNCIYLQLSSPITDGQAVAVTNPDGSLWPSTMTFASSSDPLRFNPAIHVNQEGYVPGFPKKAMIGYYAGNLGEMNVDPSVGFKIVNAATGATAYSGTLTLRADVGYTYSPTPYQKVLQADFSSLTSPGEYQLVVPGLGASLPFVIDEGIAMGFARTYALGLYHQRCGYTLQLPFTRFTHDACHVGPAQIPTSDSSFSFTWSCIASKSGGNTSQTAPQITSPSTMLYPFVNQGTVDVRGGHHDAGDYSKYTINSAQLAHELMFAADSIQGAGALDNLGLPESGDGISDLLQEAKQETDYIAKLQDADGGFYFIVYPKNREYENNTIPGNTDTQVVWPKNTSATAACVAALAQAASSPAFKKAYPTEAAAYLAKAKLGWTFLQNAIAKYGRAGAYQKVTFYGDNFNDSDELAWAACQMYLATGDTQYQTKLFEYFPDPSDSNTFRWGWWRMSESWGNAIRSYAFGARSGRVASSALDATYLAKCEQQITLAGDDALTWSKNSAYGTAFPTETKHVQSAGWYFSLDQASDMAVAYQINQKADYVDALVGNMNYEAGTNPVNVTYLTGLGMKRQHNIVSQWALNARQVLPMDGIPLGNVQSNFDFLTNYGAQGNELAKLSFPSDATNSNPMYPFYDRWADTWNVTTEFVSVQQSRSIMAVSMLAAQTKAASTPWKPTQTATIVVPTTTVGVGAPVTLSVTAPVDLTGARIVWEARDQQPDYGSTYTISPVNNGAQWVEVEITWPDGRRMFGTNTFNANSPVVTWVDDALPAGAQINGSEPWTWVSSSPSPESKTLAHQSALASGLHEHAFNGATATLVVGSGDTMFAWVYLDPQNVPQEIMLHWNDGSWEHRAYWGANLIGYGTDGTASRYHVGALPAAGGWVKLEVPASAVGLGANAVQGMCFSTYGGRATWDAAGKSSPTQ